MAVELFANVYEYARPGDAKIQFCGNVHAELGEANESAAFELRHERFTRRIGIVRIKPKFSANGRLKNFQDFK